MLTVVLPIKDRHEFARRFVRHFFYNRLPYELLIADGSKEQFGYLVGRGHEYIRYPYDETLAHYHAKMADVLSRVTTPYVMLADDDDFVLRSGTDKAIEYLETHPDYVCCGGGLAGFSLYGNSATGRINKWSYRYTHLDRSIDINSISSMERLAIGSRNWWSYYAIYRTKALQTITKEVKEIDFSDLQLREFYYAMRTMTLGKAYSDPTTISYMRQYRTSMEGFRHDWVYHILRSDFNRDLDRLITRISSQTEDEVAAREILLKIFEEWLTEFIRIYYGTSQSFKQVLRTKVPWLYRWLIHRRRYGVIGERIRLFDRLSLDGASTEYLTQFRSELQSMTELCASP
jgi:glycosyltransferase domain-containing protein